MSDPTFVNGKGLDVHVRTEIVRSWSYIKAAALRIGDDILEVEGGEGLNRYWFNKEYQGKIATIGGFPIMDAKAKRKGHMFNIDLGDGEEIEIRTYKEYVRVDFKRPKENLYANTVGILGDFTTGKKLGRDGVAIFEDYNEFGQEWQVLLSEPRLFHDIDGSKYPKKYGIPSAVEMRRRLGESSITREDAELACSRVISDDFDFCVFDVITLNDKGAAGAY